MTREQKIIAKQRFLISALKEHDYEWIDKLEMELAALESESNGMITLTDENVKSFTDIC